MINITILMINHNAESLKIIKIYNQVDSCWELKLKSYHKLIRMNLLEILLLEIQLTPTFPIKMFEHHSYISCKYYTNGYCVVRMAVR